MHKRMIATALIVAALTTHAHAAPKDDYQTTLQDIKDSKASQEKISKELQAVQKELEDVKMQATRLATELRAKEADIATQEARLNSLRKDLTAKETNFATRKRDVGSLIHAMLRMQRMPRQFILATPGEAEPILRTASALNVSYSAVETEIDALSKDINELTQLREDVTDKRDAIETERKNMLSQQNDIKKTIQKRQTLQSKLNKDHELLEKKITELTRRSGSLKELITNLNKESAIFQHVGIPQSKPDIPERLSNSFTGQKGSLPYPAIGTLIHRFGEKKGKNDRYQGHMLRTGSNAQVTAPYGGTIVFSGTFMDYGKMIIIQHDNQYHSLVAGLSNVGVSLNQKVGSGEPIGIMGATLKARELYFELRKSSKPIDPSAWMGNVIVANH